MASSMRRYFCRHCGAAFTTSRTDRYFCCPEHQNEFKSLRLKEGYRLIELAIASRLDRSTANLANANAARRNLYVEITRICDDERIRRARRAEKIAEIRAGGFLPEPVEPVDHGSQAIRAVSMRG